MRALKTLRLVVLVLLAGSARAEAAAATWHLNVQTYSWHESTFDEDLRDATPGIGLIRREGNWLAGAGVFRNSIGRWAGYGYGGWQKTLGPVRLGGIAGLTHHYRWNDGGVVPLAAVVATIPLGTAFAVDLIGIPRLKNATYATLNVSFSWQFR